MTQALNFGVIGYAANTDTPRLNITMEKKTQDLSRLQLQTMMLETALGVGNQISLSNISSCWVYSCIPFYRQAHSTSL